MAKFRYQYSPGSEHTFNHFLGCVINPEVALALAESRQQMIAGDWPAAMATLDALPIEHAKGDDIGAQMVGRNYEHIARAFEPGCADADCDRAERAAARAQLFFAYGGNLERAKRTEVTPDNTRELLSVSDINDGVAPIPIAEAVESGPEFGAHIPDELRAPLAPEGDSGGASADPA